jgi:hypothetical protein
MDFPQKVFVDVLELPLRKTQKCPKKTQKKKKERKVPTCLI